jgi:hypothetical protein
MHMARLAAVLARSLILLRRFVAFGGDGSALCDGFLQAKASAQISGISST